jgi:hypothetical protein
MTERRSGESPKPGALNAGRETDAMIRNATLGDWSYYERIARREFPEDSGIVHLLRQFLDNRREYSPSLVELLFQMATGSLKRGTDQCAPGPSWELQRLAALSLQHQFLCLPTHRFDESVLFLDRLGLLSDKKSSVRLKESVLKEGYTTTQPDRFLREFRRHLRRLDRVLAPMRRRRLSPSRFRDFLAVSRAECKLSLARYLFRDDEVAQRIYSQVRVANGEPMDHNRLCPSAEAARRLALLPDFEGAIMRSLSAGFKTYWATEGTSARINSLVEQPLGTVVLTIKPPGSSLEIEIKRAGRSTTRPIGVVFERDGKLVPPPHRLDGGSSVEMLRWEAWHAAQLAVIYRQIHKSDAPISITTAITYPDEIPVGTGRARQLIDYLTDPTVFGADYASMREALRRSIAAFQNERGGGLPELTGTMGETVQFLQRLVPAQSILIGSSSFRLDRLSRYLSENGAHDYLQAGLGTRLGRAESRRFADAIMEEILGDYEPPPYASTSHAEYLRAAFALRSNRARADRVHAALSRQLGTFWGTLLAIRARSSGESFVGRNVGLRSVWDRGRWGVRLIFMDHDSLELPTEPGTAFAPAYIFRATVRDETQVTGPPEKRPFHLCAVDYLRLIYRVDEDTFLSHREIRERSMALAYQKTLKRLAKSRSLKRLIPAEFIADSQAWEAALRVFVQSRQEVGDSSTWVGEADSVLSALGVADETREAYLKAIEEFGPFFLRHKYLFGDVLPRPRSRS